MAGPVCPSCKNLTCSRKKRAGGMQFLLGKLGYFPWECNQCRRLFLQKKRGRRRGSTPDKEASAADIQAFVE